MNIYGKNLSKRDFLKYVGDISQVADARESVLSSGKADRIRAIDVKTGSGFNFTVLPTRGMDISWAEYKGNAVSFISKSGVVHPSYFEKDGLSFSRNFFCGLMTTCGLTYFGAPCEDGGETLGLHGRASNIPAKDVSVKKYWDNDEYIMSIQGKVVQSSIFGENIELTRNIETKLGSRSVKITDTVENLGFDEQPFMLLYHCNFGYPLVDDNTILIEPEGTKIVARDSEGIVEICKKFQKPTHDYYEQVFYHDIPMVKKPYSYASLFNNKIGFGVVLKFNREQFSHFGEWKLMGEGDYVIGLEPSNAIPEGRDVVRKRGELNFIKPGEIKTFELEINMIESISEIKELFN